MKKVKPFFSKTWNISWPFMLFIIILGLWILYKYELPCWINGDSEERGLFGDSFGALNTLFTGFAFAGVIISLIYQRNELKLQREELQLQRLELKKSVEAQESSSESFKEQISISNGLNTYTVLKQLLDETMSLFNQLEFYSGQYKLHNQHVINQTTDWYKELKSDKSQDEFLVKYMTSSAFNDVVGIFSNLQLITDKLLYGDCEKTGKKVLINRIKNVIIDLNALAYFNIEMEKLCRKFDRKYFLEKTAQLNSVYHIIYENNKKLIK